MVQVRVVAMVMVTRRTLTQRSQLDFDLSRIKMIQ